MALVRGILDANEIRTVSTLRYRELGPKFKSNTV